MNRYLLEIVGTPRNYFVIEASTPEAAVLKHVKEYPALEDKTFTISDIQERMGEFKLAPRTVEYNYSTSAESPYPSGGGDSEQDSTTMPNTENKPESDDIPF